MTKQDTFVRNLLAVLQSFEKWQKNNPAGGNQQGTEQNALTKCSLSILEQERLKVNGNARALQDKAV